jgi:hypothetical protein
MPLLTADRTLLELGLGFVRRETLSPRARPA